ncbi:hypothetical protein XA68_12066 [Ophiocordyceps unilateralis]|uniref:Carboxypeptidase n=1 Tax=Ophiocordyceps unilateralis TaxID=268505 RepID=A0A2A9PFH1_OPHUN|nr:hypothetical protein XA68_12066 [Ophiocordyceps unilateralis]
MRLSALAVAVAFAGTVPGRARLVVPRPESFWDQVVHGADVAQLSRRRQVDDNQLSSYTLRSKKSDPARLNVDSVKQYSGYLDDEANNKHLFYWFFESRNKPDSDPVVLWLNGGPGCSSMIGLFTELGPSTLPTPDLKPKRNDYSWNANASIIFLDQPVNTGYSYSNDEVNTTAAASRDVYALLSLFFHQFPQYAGRDFHIAGESYAGHYIPIIAKDILSKPGSGINLKSILIGNGLTDPLTQYRYYRPMACGEGGYPSVLDKATCEAMDKSVPECEALIQACYDGGDEEKCSRATRRCNDSILGAYEASNRSAYDVRKGPQDGPPDYSAQFLNTADVMEALGSEVDSFRPCNMRTNGDFVSSGDWMLPIHRSVPDILQRIPVLIYAGDADFICNWLGNAAWVKALEWPGRDQFNKAPNKSLLVDGSAYGEVHGAQNLTFMRIFAAGHMVPSDQPKGSLDFFNRWLHGEWWSR